MDFLKDIIKLQTKETLIKISEKILINDNDKINFINKFNKVNYQIIKICNCKMISKNRVKINTLISNL